MSNEPAFGACSKCAPEDISHVWETVNVPLGDNGYDILIGPGILAELGPMLNDFMPERNFIMVTDSTVEDFLGIDLISLLESADLKVSMITFPAGEESKCMGTIAGLARSMVDLGADRSTVILALGGGVTGVWPDSWPPSICVELTLSRFPPLSLPR